MDEIVSKIFNMEHIKIVPLEKPDENFPTRISGISCNHCGKTYHHDADFMIDHLQHKHDFKIREIIPSIR